MSRAAKISPSRHGQAEQHRTVKFTSPPSSFKPFRDRKVPIKTVPCSECKAEAGSPCITQAGTPSKSYHRTRRRYALHLQRQQLET